MEKNSGFDKKVHLGTRTEVDKKRWAGE